MGLMYNKRLFCFNKIQYFKKKVFIGGLNMRELFYATGNKGKFEDVSHFVTNQIPDVQLICYPDDLPELQSTDQRFVAIEKGREAWSRLKKPVVIDDAGIYFAEYNNFPGVFTKYLYKGIGFSGIRKLVADGAPVYYQLHLVYFYGDDQYEVFVGRCDGIIRFPPVLPAETTLPYDAIFVPVGDTRTFAQLRAIGEREQYDHRIAAFKKLVEWLRFHSSN